MLGFLQRVWGLHWNHYGIFRFLSLQPLLGRRELLKICQANRRHSRADPTWLQGLPELCLPAATANRSSWATPLAPVTEAPARPSVGLPKNVLGSHFGDWVNSPPILEPSLMGIGMFTRGTGF